MAGPKTQGFQVSALPRAPNIPSNIGVVDIKAIDEGVRRGLATFEAIRSAPRSMVLADAQMLAKTEQAPLSTRLALAETEAFEAQAPLKTALLSLQEEKAAKEAPLLLRKLEAETSPEYLDAKMKHLLRTMNPSGVREFELLTAGMTPAEKEHARRIKFGIDPRSSSAAITYHKVIGADGVERFVAVDPRAVGAQVIGSGETYGSGVVTPGTSSVAAAQGPAAVAVPAASTTPAVVEVDELGNPIGAVATEGTPVSTPIQSLPATAPTTKLFQSPTIQEKKSQEVTGAKTAEMFVEAKSKLPKALSALTSLEAKTDRVEREIDEAIARANNWSVGYGSVLKNIPNTEARKMAAILRSIDANMGFDALTEMRQNSPTGGALGQVSDFENKLLKATIADLDQATDVPFIKAQLLKIKKERQDAVTRLRAQFDREKSYFGLSDADFSAVAEQARQPIQLPSSSEWSEDKEKRLQELRSKLGK